MHDSCVYTVLFSYSKHHPIGITCMNFISLLKWNNNIKLKSDLANSFILKKVKQITDCNMSN